MIFTDEQFEALAPYEPTFRTAVQAGWARYPGVRAAQHIQEIATAAGVAVGRLNPSCSFCVTRLLKRVGKMWFDDQAERIAAKNDAEAAKLAAEAAKTPAEEALSAEAEPKPAAKKKSTSKSAKK